MIYFSHLMEDKEALKLLNEDLGIETIEFAIGSNLNSMDERAEKYVKTLSLAERNPAGKINLHGPFLDLNPASYDDSIAKVSRNRYEECYRAAMKIKGNRIIFHSCFIPSVYFIEGWAPRMADFWNSFLEDKQDIQISMENLLEEEIYPMRDVWEKVDAENFSLCLDTGHAHCYSKHSVEEWVRELNCSIGHLHLHDNLGLKDEHAPLGEGNINWDKVIHMLYDLELFSFTLEHTYAEQVAKSLAFLKKNYREYYDKCFEENSI